jgi:hypothetical protein
MARVPRGNLPARYPSTVVWPAQMRADMTAAFLDYPDTRALAAAVRQGDAPPPTSLRGKGRLREPVWARDELERFVAPTAKKGHNSAKPKEDLRSLV